MAIDPITAISAFSTLSGLAGSLFGSGRQQIPIDPRILEVFKSLQTSSEEGISDDAIRDLMTQASASISNEAGGLAANQRRRTALAGGGVGAQNVGASRLNSARLQAIGSASTQASLADEKAKQEAQRLLVGFAPALQPQSFETGGGFSDLFRSGLGLLFNQFNKNRQTDTRQANFFDFATPNNQRLV